MSAHTATLLAVGDIILGPAAEVYFRSVQATLQAADVVVGQLEVPYTTRDAEAVALGRVPQNLAPLAANGFSVLTLAGNHLTDAGAAGIADTIAWLDQHGIAHVGAGMNLGEARRPAILERNGIRFGFLDYNCVGPKETAAGQEKPGCAAIDVITHYQLGHANPGGPPAIYTWAEPGSLQAMVADIRSLRPRCDVLVVALHKGLVHTPVKVADYEREISHAAVDAGADLVVGHHAHILKGIELYKDKPIFHGLGNFVVWLPSLAPKPGQDRHAWAQKRLALFGFTPDPDYPTYPFHPEAVHTIMAQCRIQDGQIQQVGYIPLQVNQQGQPEVLGRDARGQAVFDYVAAITRQAGLNARYAWEGDTVLVFS